MLAQVTLLPLAAPNEVQLRHNAAAIHQQPLRQSLPHYTMENIPSSFMPEAMHSRRTGSYRERALSDSAQTVPT